MPTYLLCKLATPIDRNPATDSTTPGPAPTTAHAKPRRTRQRRTAHAPLDVDGLIRNTVAKVQAQGEAEVERMRAAMRKAIGVLEAAVG